jgi:hypothetical protein
MLKVLAVNLCTLAFAMTYYGNKKKTYTFYKYRVGTKITSLHLLFFSLPSLTICLSQSSTLVQNPLVSSFPFPPPDGLPQCLPHPYILPLCELGQTGVACQMWDQNMPCALAHTHLIWARAQSITLAGQQQNNSGTFGWFVPRTAGWCVLHRQLSVLTRL